MALLFEEDYESLAARSIHYEEGEVERFFVFKDVFLPLGIYTDSTCDVLIVVPPNYNQAGNDMFWTYPRLRRQDGASIPQTNEIGGGDNRNWQGKEYCRWSRHWHPPSPGVWRAGRDDIISIFRRVDWALRNPGAQ